MDFTYFTEILSMTSQKKQPSPQLESLLLAYCKNIDTWADSWEIGEKDQKTGEAIVEEFKLFLINRIEKGRAKKTIKNCANYLWVLGGELIRRVNDDESERRLTVRKLILKYVDESGGPYWRHAHDESDHARYDSVCRQLFKFMMADSV